MDAEPSQAGRSAPGNGPQRRCPLLSPRPSRLRRSWPRWSPSRGPALPDPAPPDPTPQTAWPAVGPRGAAQRRQAACGCWRAGALLIRRHGQQQQQRGKEAQPAWPRVSECMPVGGGCRRRSACRCRRAARSPGSTRRARRCSGRNRGGAAAALALQGEGKRGRRRRAVSSAAGRPAGRRAGRRRTAGRLRSPRRRPLRLWTGRTPCCWCRRSAC